MSVTNRLGDTSDNTLCQWLVDLPTLATILNWPITIQDFTRTGAELHFVSKKQDGSAEEVRDAWSRFAATLGPTVFGNVMATEHWRQLVPDVNVPSEDYQTVVWQSDLREVVCFLLTDDDGKFLNYEFRVCDKVTEA